MPVSDLLTAVHRKTRYVIDQLPGGALSVPPVLVLDLVPIIEAVAKLPAKSIEIMELTYQQKNIYGMLARQSDSAQIFVHTNLNFCWRRFVACKELAHLIIDDDESHFTKDIHSLLSGLATQGLVWGLSTPVASEKLAFYAAIELLVPRALYPALRARIAANETNLQIAHYFKVPEVIIELLRSAGYRTLSLEMGVDQSSLL